MEQRRLGRTDHRSTVLILGGAGIGRVSQAAADQAIELAMQHGVNHIDVAPSYGEAELRLKPWLARHRQDFFLGCKTTKRSKAEAWEELHRSLDRLQTSSVDLYQLHAVGTVEDLDAALGPGGAIEAFIEARDQGLTRYLGITGHGLTAPATHAEALRRFDFDTVMFPLNYVLWSQPQYRRDAEGLLSLADSKDVGVQVIKAIAHRSWGEQERTHQTWYEPFVSEDDIARALRFVLSQPVAAAPIAGDISLWPAILDAAERYRPLAADEQEALVRSGGNLAAAAPAPLFAA
ncbi:MAG: aldo/keto reductase [Dehalococcoidia bacterium]|nr:aldo/keto reductase [Dehalococcoidia bacterium]